MNSVRVPRWGLFVYANVVATVAFIASCAWLLQFWGSASSAQRTVRYCIAQPACVAAASAAALSGLYLLAFAGVAFVYAEVQAEQRPHVVVPDATKSGYDADVVVVGGGCTGASVAVALAKQGRKVVVIERQPELPDSVKGELLQPGGVRALEGMGLRECATTAEIDCVRVDGYAVIKPGTAPGEELMLKYPVRDPACVAEFVGVTQENPAPGSTPGAPHGSSFHHRRFVYQLRKAAQSTPGVDYRDGRVTQLTYADKPAADGRPLVTGVEYKTLDNAEVHQLSAPLVIVADGIYSMLRKHVASTISDIVTVSQFVGYELQHKAGECPLPHLHHGHVILAQPSPVLMYQISATETRILVDVLGALPDEDSGELAQYMLSHVCPQLPESVQPYFQAAVKSQNPIIMPNKKYPPQSFKVARAALLGDAWNMRHPLTGGGMTVALKDSYGFSQAVQGIDLMDLSALDAAIAAHAQQRRAAAGTINVLANALHRVFSTPTKDDGTRSTLRDACFDYMNMGGAFAAGPIGLLAGLTPTTWVLALHFFAVALYAVGFVLRGTGSCAQLGFAARAVRAWNMLRVACAIIMPLLVENGVSVLARAPVAFASNVVFPWESLVSQL